ncbi:MAG: hypothetical protein ABFD69_08175 [Candidatus Sumerlaeia bacterium]
MPWLLSYLDIPIQEIILKRLLMLSALVAACGVTMFGAMAVDGACIPRSCAYPWKAHYDRFEGGAELIVSFAAGLNAELDETEFNKSYGEEFKAASHRRQAEKRALFQKGLARHRRPRCENPPALLARHDPRPHRHERGREGEGPPRQGRRPCPARSVPEAQNGVMTAYRTIFLGFVFQRRCHQKYCAGS